MPQRLRLEVFDSGAETGRPLVVLNGEDFEDARLAAFEEGYRAGWDDAMAAQTDEGAAVRQAISARLADLAGGLGEVRAEVTAAVRPLLETMIAAVLPEIARHALPAQIVDALVPFAELATETAIELAVSPANAATAEAALIEASCTLPVRLIEDPAIGPNAATLRLGPAETWIDLDAVIARILGLTADFFDQITRERRHG